MSIFSGFRFSAAAMALAGSALTAVPVAYAHDAGDVIFRLGVAGSRVAHDLKLDESVGGLINGDLKKSSTQAGLNLTYMATESIGVDLFMTSPANHKYTIRTNLGGTEESVNIGKLQQLPLSLSAVYFPMEKNADFQPYVGLGVTYVRNKFKENVGGIDRLVDLVTPYGVTADVEDDLAETVDMKKNKLGFGGVLGFDYNFDKNWLFNAQVRYTRLSKDDVKSRTNYMAGIGYRF